MNALEKSLIKNAPLASWEDRTDFVAWATSIPDGNISAGWQPMHPPLADSGCASPMTPNIAPAVERKPANRSGLQGAGENSDPNRGGLKAIVT